MTGFCLLRPQTPIPHSSKSSHVSLTENELHVTQVPSLSQICLSSHYKITGYFTLLFQLNLILRWHLTPQPQSLSLGGCELFPTLQSSKSGKCFEKETCCVKVTGLSYQRTLPNILPSYSIPSILFHKKTASVPWRKLPMIWSSSKCQYFTSAYMFVKTSNGFFPPAESCLFQ